MLMPRKDVSTNEKAPKKGGGWITGLAIAFMCIGLAVAAYPFVLIQINTNEKDAVVAKLESELPIHRDEAEFEPIDIASMPVVPVPKWTPDEIRQAGEPLGVIESMVGEDTMRAISRFFGGEKATPLPLITRAPAAVIPDAPVATPAPTDPPEFGVQVHTYAPTQPPIAVADAAAPQHTQLSPNMGQGAAVPPAQAGEQPIVAAGEQPIVVAGEQPIVAAGEQPIVAAGEQPIAVAGEQPIVAAGEQPIVAAGSQQNTQQSTIALPDATFDPNGSAFQASGMQQETISGVQKAQPLLRDAAPVFYEDFANILSGAQKLATSFDTIYNNADTKKRKIEPEVPVSLTIDSIHTQLQGTHALLQQFQSLPSANTMQAPMQSTDGSEKNIPMMQGSQLLAQDLQALSTTVAALERITVLPDAVEDVHKGLDEIVLLSDQVINVLDYMAANMNEGDIERYVHIRSSSMVGTTEAVYLLEMPSIAVKVGVFTDLTFEQMYKSMRKGAAMFPRVGAPNTNTNISMSAHRSGSAAFFSNFDRVQVGDVILMHTRTLGSFRYIVDQVGIIEKDNWDPTLALGYPALTLLSCEEYQGISNGRRIVVRARLVGIAR